MTEKERFVTLAQTGRFTISSLCKDFGISRKTGHKYLSRYEAEGRDGLKERSRRPKHYPNATVDSVEKLILKERRKHPTWGPKKIRDLLMKIHGIERPPHESTIALALSRHGLSQKRKRKAGVYRVHPEHLTEPTRPNDVWTFDFKGWFLLQDGQRFERWRHEYNHDRPHESLDMLRPAEIYRKSCRRLGQKDKMLYPDGYEVKRVS